MNRHIIATRAQTELDKARANSVALQNAEEAMVDFHGSMLHSAQVAKRHYIHLTDKQAAFRCSIIDSAVFSNGVLSNESSDHSDPISENPLSDSFEDRASSASNRVLAVMASLDSNGSASEPIMEVAVLTTNSAPFASDEMEQSMEKDNDQSLLPR